MYVVHQFFVVSINTLDQWGDCSLNVGVCFFGGGSREHWSELTDAGVDRDSLDYICFVCQSVIEIVNEFL